VHYLELYHILLMNGFYRVKRVLVKDHPFEKGDISGLIPHHFEGDLVGRVRYLPMADGAH
jgi:hypothetical protein